MPEIKVNSQPLGAKNGLMKISGQLESATFEHMEDEINRLLESGIIGLGADVSGLESVSSAGLGLFVNLAETLRERKGKFMLINPVGDVKEIIDVLGVAEALNLVESIDAAKKELSKIT
jgi:Anti-anti-sigma regulatory factor (antagonist of anti-sigma factor)